MVIKIIIQKGLVCHWWEYTNNGIFSKFIAAGIYAKQNSGCCVGLPTVSTQEQWRQSCENFFKGYYRSSGDRLDYGGRRGYQDGYYGYNAGRGY